MVKNRGQLSIVHRRHKGPLRLITLSDSAFKAQDTQGAVMRGCVVMHAEAGTLSADTSVASNAPRSEKIWQTKTTVNCHCLDWYSKKHSPVVRSTHAAELLSALGATNQGRLPQLCLEEVHRGARSEATLLSQSERSIPLDVGIDAKAVFESIAATHIRTPYDKHLLLHVRAMREFLEARSVDRLYWFDTEDMLPDGLTKRSINREPLIQVCREGI